MHTQRPQKKISESGQGTIEYILILMFAIGGATLVSRSIKVFWEQNVNRMGGRLEQSLKTGRLPQRAWRE